MSDSIRKALSDAGEIGITIKADYKGNVSYHIHESAFRLDGYKQGEITKAELDAEDNPDGLIQKIISEAFRKNHILWEARKESGVEK